MEICYIILNGKPFTWNVYVRPNETPICELIDAIHFQWNNFSSVEKAKKMPNLKQLANVSCLVSLEWVFYAD